MPGGADVALLGRILPCAGLPGHRYRQTRVDFRRDSAMANVAVYGVAAPALGCRARVWDGRSRFSPRNSKVGEAMKIDEDVPITMPNMIARPKPRITSPPISASGRIDRT